VIAPSHSLDDPPAGITSDPRDEIATVQQHLTALLMEQRRQLVDGQKQLLALAEEIRSLLVSQNAATPGQS
jgi:hypothetical protein